MADRTPKKFVSKPSVHVCRCCNDNVFERQHPIDLYGPKATKESILPLLERLTGFKFDINDGLSLKVCRPCYEKIMNFKKFSNIFCALQHNSSLYIQFKRCKTQGDSPSVYEKLYLTVQVIRFLLHACTLHISIHSFIYFLLLLLLF